MRFESDSKKLRRCRLYPNLRRAAHDRTTSRHDPTANPGYAVPGIDTPLNPGRGFSRLAGKRHATHDTEAWSWTLVTSTFLAAIRSAGTA